MGALPASGAQRLLLQHALDRPSCSTVSLALSAALEAGGGKIKNQFPDEEEKYGKDASNVDLTHIMKCAILAGSGSAEESLQSAVLGLHGVAKRQSKKSMRGEESPLQFHEGGGVMHAESDDNEDKNAVSAASGRRMSRASDEDGQLLRNAAGQFVASSSSTGKRALSSFFPESTPCQGDSKNLQSSKLLQEIAEEDTHQASGKSGNPPTAHTSRGKAISSCVSSAAPFLEPTAKQKQSAGTGVALVEVAKRA
ncbi:unnamed protein product, partial [Amoebophrya sp. A25]|eukprot:GSA25T00023953001.1